MAKRDLAAESPGDIPGSAKNRPHKDHNHEVYEEWRRKDKGHNRQKE